MFGIIPRVDSYHLKVIFVVVSLVLSPFGYKIFSQSHYTGRAGVFQQQQPPTLYDCADASTMEINFENDCFENTETPRVTTIT